MEKTKGETKMEGLMDRLIGLDFFEQTRKPARQEADERDEYIELEDIDTDKDQGWVI